MKAETSEVYPNAISRCIGNMAQGKVANSLDRDTGCNSHDCEEYEGEKIKKHDQSEDEGETETWHSVRLWSIEAFELIHKSGCLRNVRIRDG